MENNSRAARPGPEAEKALTVDEFRREVQDKLSVVASLHRSTPLNRSIFRQQCEDFLVEAFAALRAAARVPEIACPACGEIVKQVSSATLGLALWQHYHWVCTGRAAVNLLKRLRGWDMFTPGCAADGAYWVAEIDKVLAAE